jgi:uncharacterized protein (DUF1330 family)
MAEGYWITFYRSISDPAALAAYAKLAGPAVTSNGGRFLARGGTVKTYEQGIAQRTIAIEFDSVEQAIAAPTALPIKRHSLRSWPLPGRRESSLEQARAAGEGTPGGAP